MARDDRDDDRPRRRDRDDDRDERRGSSRDRDDDRRSSRDRDDRDDDRRPSRGRDDDDDRGSSRGGSSYRYEKRDPDSTKRRSEQAGNTEFDKFLKIKMWRPNDGNNRIRILPPTWAKPEHFGYDIYVHYGVGPDRQSYLCLDKMQGKPDPIAEAHAEARKELTGDERDDDPQKKYVKDLEAKRRVLVYLVDRDHEKEGVQAYAMPWTLDRDITQVMQDKRSGEVLPIDDPDEGYDVEFTKKGSKNRTEYTGVAIARRSSPLGSSKWMDFAVDNPLTEQLVYFDYEHIAKAFGGGGKQRSDRDRDDRDDRGGDDDRPRRRDDDRDDRDDRGRRDDDERRGRQDEDRRGGGRSRSDGRDDEPTWASVHKMTHSELVDLVEQKRLPIKPKEAKDDDDLADWVCEELKLKKPRDDDPPARERVRDSNDDDDRLERMRQRRERD